MIRQLEIAKAYLIEAHNDYEVVSLLIEKEKFNLAVYHAQQAVEKILKACLAAEGKIGIYKHEVFSFFINAFNDKIDIETMALLEESVVPLEENWAISRYPDWSKDSIKILVRFLKVKYKIQV